MKNKILIITGLILLVTAVSLWAEIPSSVMFQQEQYDYSKTTQTEEGTKYEFIGTQKYYKKEDFSIQRELSFLKYTHKRQNPFEKPLGIQESYQRLLDTPTPDEYKDNLEIKLIKDGIKRYELSQCSDGTIVDQWQIYVGKKLCGVGFTRYTIEGEISISNLMVEFLEYPLETYQQALCEMKMI